MDTVIENRPVNKALRDYLERRASAGPSSFFAYGDADPLPSMFRRSQAGPAAPKPRNMNGRGGFSPYIIILFLLGIVPVQIALLTSQEGAIEQVPVLAKRRAADIAALLFVPSAEAAIRSQSQSLAPASAAFLSDSRWSETVDTFKLLLAEQTAPARKQEENGRLLRQLEAWLNARTEKPAKVAGICAMPSLNCWKSATFIR
jgi:hypothetical protein